MRPPVQARRQVVHRHIADKPLVPQRNPAGEVHPRKGGMAKAFDRDHLKPRKQAQRHVQLMAKVQKHAAAFRPRGIALGKPPVRPPLRHVMADGQGELEHIGQVRPRQRPQRRVVAHHVAQHRPFRDRCGGPRNRLNLLRRKGQRLFDIDGQSPRRRRLDQRQPDVGRGGHHHRLRPVHRGLGPGKPGLAPGQQLGFRTKRAQIAVMPPPDRPGPDDQNPHGLPLSGHG